MSDSLAIWLALVATVIGWGVTFLTQRAILRETRKHLLIDRKLKAYAERATALQRYTMNILHLSRAVQEDRFRYRWDEDGRIPKPHEDVLKSMIALGEDISSADLHLALAYFPERERGAIFQEHQDLLVRFASLRMQVLDHSLSENELEAARETAWEISRGLAHLAVDTAARYAELESEILEDSGRGRKFPRGVV